MYVITHFVIGATIGLVLVDPVLAFLGGCVSHALADMTPHHDPQGLIPGLLSVVPVLGIDSLLGSWGYGLAVLAGGIGGVIPDAEHVLTYLHRGDS